MQFNLYMESELKVLSVSYGSKNSSTGKWAWQINRGVNNSIALYACMKISQRNNRSYTHICTTIIKQKLENKLVESLGGLWTGAVHLYAL